MTTPVSFRAGDSLIERLDETCDKEGYSRAEATREAIRRFIREME